MKTKTVVITTLVVLTLSFLWGRAILQKPTVQPKAIESSFENETTMVAAQNHTPTVIEDRPIYPMSVIPGGIKSINQLREYLDQDPIAKQSFQNYANNIGDPNLLNNLVIRQSEKPIIMHTQLRKGRQIFWSSRPVTIEPGEDVVYTRQNDVVMRGRCGNLMMVSVPKSYPTCAMPPERPLGPSPEPPVPATQPLVERQQPSPMVVRVSVPAASDLPSITMPPITIKNSSNLSNGSIIIEKTKPLPTTPSLVSHTQENNDLRTVQQNHRNSKSWLAIAALVFIRGHGNHNYKPPCHHKQEPEPVPEPSTMCLMGLGMGIAAFIARRKKKASQ